MNLLEKAAKLCAVLAGVLLVVITLMTCVSLIGRNTIGWTHRRRLRAVGLCRRRGDRAVHALVPGPARQHHRRLLHRQGAAPATQDRLDRFGALMLALAMGLMAWRTTIGGLNAWNSQAGSMMMGFPEWIVYVGMVPPLVLTAVIALVQAVRGFARASRRRHDADHARRC